MQACSAVHTTSRPCALSLSYMSHLPGENAHTLQQCTAPCYNWLSISGTVPFCYLFCMKSEQGHEAPLSWDITNRETDAPSQTSFSWVESKVWHATNWANQTHIIDYNSPQIDNTLGSFHADTAVIDVCPIFQCCGCHWNFFRVTIFGEG